MYQVPRRFPHLNRLTEPQFRNLATRDTTQTHTSTNKEPQSMFASKYK